MVINSLSSGKVMMIHLAVGLIEKDSINILYKMSQYFLKPYERPSRNLKSWIGSM